MKLVIKGAYYYEKELNMIIVPHYTGEYRIVDCDIYKILPEIMEMYDDEFIEESNDNNIEYNGETYFYAEYSPLAVDEHWELLSDLSELYHIEENYNW